VNKESRHHTVLRSANTSTKCWFTSNAWLQ